jgi:hypothetical protein
MSYYDDKPDDLIQDTKNFLDSDYGKHIVTTLLETGKGDLSSVADIKAEHPDRYAAKYSALKEVLDLIYQPLDDHIPPHGL